MTLTMNLGDFQSRAVRLSSTANQGVRRIAVNADTQEEDNDGGFLRSFDGALKFGASLVGNLFNSLGGFLRFSWSALWGTVTRAGLFLINFNWNITDAQIDDQIKQADIALSAAKGSLAGQSLGFAVCGLIPAATIAVFNEPLGLYMMSELGEEAADEIAGSLATLVQLQLQQTARRGFFSLFKNYRTLFRGAAIGFATALKSVGILSQESIDKATTNRNKPWSIAIALEDTVDSIVDPSQQAYAEEFWDEFQDSCIEAGFIVAGSADSYFALQKMANQSQFGSERIVEIQPIRNENEVTP